MPEKLEKLPRLSLVVQKLCDVGGSQRRVRFEHRDSNGKVISSVLFANSDDLAKVIYLVTEAKIYLSEREP